MTEAGSKNARSVIEEFQRLLNAPHLLPDQTLRRNAVHYALVSYLNNITGLYLSGNYASIPVFVARAFEHMSQRPPEALYRPYFALADAYLKQVIYFLREFTDIILEGHDRIPSEALIAGPQKPNQRS
jgi:hypothetical protein